MYSTSDFLKCGQLEAIRIILALPFRRAFKVCLYPKMALPDFITSLRRLFIESCCFFCTPQERQNTKKSNVRKKTNLSTSQNATIVDKSHARQLTLRLEDASTNHLLNNFQNCSANGRPSTFQALKNVVVMMSSQ